jgi:DNA repair protein RecN (Recombination protein N)
VSSVLAHAERCRAERDRLEGLEDSLGELEAALERAEAEERERAAALGAARAEAAPRLAQRVQGELGALAMGDAAFEVLLEPRAELGPAGAERAEFLVAANRGHDPAPVREIASGGELSRIMLALSGVASAGGPETLVFDEVDAGVGGQTARAVGERLRGLATERQVLCITHLPQIASLADRHYRVDKLADGELARASVERLDDDAKVDELCRMLGAEGDDSAARRHAEELLAAA